MGQQLLTRYGVVTREVASAEAVAGRVQRHLRRASHAGGERTGPARLLRGRRRRDAVRGAGRRRPAARAAHAAGIARRRRLAATDPANPYGALVKWPDAPDPAAGRGPTRSVGARVVLVDGHLTAWIARGLRSLLVWLPEHDPDRTRHAEALAHALARTGTDPGQRAASVLLTEMNGGPALDSPLRPFLEAAGFVATPQGLQWRDPGSTGPAMPRARRPGRWDASVPVDDLPDVADEDVAPIQWPRRAPGRTR